MYKVIVIDTNYIIRECRFLADAAAIGSKLNAEHGYEFCYIFKDGEGAYRPEYCYLIEDDAGNRSVIRHCRRSDRGDDLLYKVEQRRVRRLRCRYRSDHGLA